jgi:hypothetical protein
MRRWIWSELNWRGGGSATGMDLPRASGRLRREVRAGTPDSRRTPGSRASRPVRAWSPDPLDTPSVHGSRTRAGVCVEGPHHGSGRTRLPRGGRKESGPCPRQPGPLRVGSRGYDNPDASRQVRRAAPPVRRGKPRCRQGNVGTSLADNHKATRAATRVDRSVREQERRTGIPGQANRPRIDRRVVIGLAGLSRFIHTTETEEVRGAAEGVLEQSERRCLSGVLEVLG